MSDSRAEPGPPLAIDSWHLVFMGVSGSGKSTVAREVQTRLGWDFAEGDDFHTRENVAKMASGHPLDDRDRSGWLRDLADWTAERDARGESTLLSCSALRRSYRDVLRQGGVGTFFVHLTGDEALLLQRMRSREDHFMPPGLLESQLETLEPLDDDEPGATYDVSLTPTEIAHRVVSLVQSVSSS